MMVVMMFMLRFFDDFIGEAYCLLILVYKILETFPFVLMLHEILFVYIFRSKYATI